jgi:hypothetical protein
MMQIHDDRHWMVTAFGANMHGALAVAVNSGFDNW